MGGGTLTDTQRANKRRKNEIRRQSQFMVILNRKKKKKRERESDRNTDRQTDRHRRIRKEMKR